jgi:copper transport protein
MAIDYAHGVAAILWIGAVIGIAVSARLAGRQGDFRKLAPRFSLAASLLVFVLLATGALSAFVEIDTPSRLWETRYGVTLLLKLGLLVPLLAVAAFNARRGVKRLAARAPGEPRRFLRAAAAEAFLGLVVIALAAALTQTTVSKSVIDTPESKPFAAKTTANDLSVALAIDPNRTGLNTYRVDLAGASGAAVAADRVRLTFRYRDDQTVGPSTLVLAAGDTPGRYAGQGPFLTLEGQWRVEVEVRRPGVDDAVGFFDVRPAGAAVAGIRRGGRWDNPTAGLTWNEFGGLVVVLVGLGFALWGSRLRRWDRRAGRAGTVVTALSFGTGALLLFGVHAHTTTTRLPTNPIFPDQNSVALGRQLYQQNCVSCHGQNGVPPKGLDLYPYPLDLTLHVPQHPDGQLYNFVALGLQGSSMRAWGEGDAKLTSDQMWHLVNFLRTLGSVDQ